MDGEAQVFNYIFVTAAVTVADIFKFNAKCILRQGNAGAVVSRVGVVEKFAQLAKAEVKAA